MLQHSIVNKNPNWETPQELFDEACRKYKVRPSLDVCATRRNKKCALFFSKDSLSKQWNKSFFMNPPYGKNVIDKWIKYAYEQHKKHNVTGIALIFSKIALASSWIFNLNFDAINFCLLKPLTTFIPDIVESNI